MSRVGQIGIVVMSLGVCIGINSWRYPIVWQMVAELPPWEFSMQPKVGGEIRSPSAATATAPGETDKKPPPGRSDSRCPLVGISSPPLADASSTAIQPKEAEPAKRDFSPTSSLDLVSPANSQPEKPLPHQSQPLKPEEAHSQDTSVCDGAPIGGADSLPNRAQPSPNACPRLPLIPLDISGKQGLSCLPIPTPSASTDSLEVCTGSACMVGLGSPVPSSAQNASLGRPRIIQVRVYPLSEGQAPNTSGAQPPPHTLPLASPQTEIQQKSDSSSWSEEKIELLPPVDTSVSGGWSRSRLPWPPGTIPFYPCTQRN